MDDLHNMSQGYAFMGDINTDMGYAFIIMGSSDKAKVVIIVQPLKINLVKTSGGGYKGGGGGHGRGGSGCEGGRGKYIYRGACRHEGGRQGGFGGCRVWRCEGDGGNYRLKSYGKDRFIVFFNGGLLRIDGRSSSYNPILRTIKSMYHYSAILEN